MGIISSKPKDIGLLAPSMEGNLKEVKRLVGILIAEKGNVQERINSVDAAGNAAIHGAVFSGHLDVLSFLVEQCEADITIKNGLGCSPLWIAAGYDRLDCLEYLVEKLHESNQLESQLLEVGANTSGDTPFLAAASRGNVKACEGLLKCVEKFGKAEDDDECLLIKANILRTSNNAGDTPLKVAVASSQGEDMIKYLLQVDDTLGECSKPSDNEHSSDYTTTKYVNRKNKIGLSPLIVACERNLPSVAELLLEHGADITILDEKGRNPLAIAAFCGCNDTVEFLLKQDQAKTYLLNQKDLNGSTPAWLAARTGNLSILELLMDAGSDATITDNEGLSPQDVAIKYKKEKVIEYFSQK